MSDAAFAFTIGSQVTCQDGKCGKLRKLVVDPEIEQVTDLIVEKSFLLKKDRVIPLDLVEEASSEDIKLAIQGDQLSSFPEYQEVSFKVPEPGQWDDKEFHAQQAVTWASVSNLYGMEISRPMMPILAFRVDKGVPEGEVLVEPGTPVWIDSNQIGQVDHMLVDQEDGKLAFLVVNQGLLARSIIIPVTEIEEIQEEGLILDLEEEDLDTLPRYRPRDEEALLEELTQRLEEASEIFQEVKASFENNVLKLTGVVPTIADKRQAEATTRSIEGVVGVENDLDADAAITARVVAALADDPRTEISEIDVASDRGLVTLIGQVDSQRIRQAAEKIAEQQQGVFKVINELEVEPDEITPSLMGRAMGFFIRI